MHNKRMQRNPYFTSKKEILKFFTEHDSWRRRKTPFLKTSTVNRAFISYGFLKQIHTCLHREKELHVYISREIYMRTYKRISLSQRKISTYRGTYRIRELKCDVYGYLIQRVTTNRRRQTPPRILSRWMEERHVCLYRHCIWGPSVTLICSCSLSLYPAGGKSLSKRITHAWTPNQQLSRRERQGVVSRLLVGQPNEIKEHAEED